MVIIETSVFTRRVQALLTDEEYRELQVALINPPRLEPSSKVAVAFAKSGGLFQVEGKGVAPESSMTGQSNRGSYSCSSCSPKMSGMTYHLLNVRL